MKPIRTLRHSRGFDELCRRTAALGLAVRGAFHPGPGELGVQLPPSMAEGTLVLLGFTGSAQWHIFAQSAEAHDGLPHPLDRWTRRNIEPVARDLGALAFYPSGTPQLPFQRLAARCEPVHPSPIGLLIHPRWGLWHAYRTALLVPERLELPALMPSVHPCVTCAARPCLSTCPVGAFSTTGFDVAACTKHVRSEAGADCRTLGCRARRACPVGGEFRYIGEQARFHMKAFLLSVEP